MKNNLLRTLCAGLLLVPMLWSCQRERIAEDIAKTNVATPQGAISGDICGGISTVGLIDASGSTVVNYCSDGFAQIPCGPNPDAWGTIDYAKYTNQGSNTANLNLDVTLGYGWYVTGYQVLVNTGSITMGSGLPTGNQTWTTNNLSVFFNQLSIDLPLGSSGLAAGCLEWTIILDVTMLDINGQPMPGSQRTLYAYDPAGQGSPYAIDACYDACAGGTTTITKGSCDGCHSSVTTTFTGCSSVSITACKNIRRVLVVYTDCSTQLFSNLNVGSFNVPSNGKTISHVFVRSGCSNGNNDKGNDDGPNGSNNANNYRRFRFDAPCYNGGC